MHQGHYEINIYSKMRELWHNQLSFINHEELLLFNISKGTLREQKVINKQTIEVTILILKIFCNFTAT